MNETYFYLELKCNSFKSQVQVSHVKFEPAFEDGNAGDDFQCANCDTIQDNSRSVHSIHVMYV